MTNATGRRKKKTAPMSRKRRLWLHFKGLASTVVFVWFFTNHIAQATIVPTPSMDPTILTGDHFFLDKVAFPANTPAALQKLLPQRTIERGDIVAFWSPEDPNLRLIKRVIGLPGETFEMRRGDVYINDRKLDEPYAVHHLPAEVRPFETIPPITIPADEFFMMGDNRDDSRDSRYFGLAHRKDLIGKPLFVYWSFPIEGYPLNDATVGKWVKYYASVAAHFATRTRWSRTGTILR